MYMHGGFCLISDSAVWIAYLATGPFPLLFSTNCDKTVEL